MDSTSPDNDPGYLAARLTLLVLRASVSREIELEADRVALLPLAGTTTEAAARTLAATEKPLLCTARVENGVLAAECRALSDAAEQERDSFHLTRRRYEERGGFLRFLSDRYGPGDHTVLAVGRDESLLLSRSAVELWHAGYEIDDVNWVADDVGNHRLAHHADYREAAARGARGILRFDSPADSKATATMFTLPLSETATPEERAEVEAALTQLARMNLAVPKERASEPGTDGAASSWERWQRQAAEEYRSSLTEAAAEMARFFAGRTVPPEVAAFIAEYGKPS